MLRQYNVRPRRAPSSAIGSPCRRRVAASGRRHIHHRAARTRRCAAPARPAGRRQAPRPARAAIASVTRPSSSRQSCQVCRLGVLVLAEDQEPGAGSAATQLAHRVERVGRRRARRSSTPVEHEARLACDRQRAPSPRGRRPAARRRAFCQGWPVGIQRSSSSASCSSAAARQREMRDVHRIEAAAEEADPPTRRGRRRPAQSRGRRKSV